VPSVPMYQGNVQHNDLDSSPVANKGQRKCRDVLCIILFAAFWILCITILFMNKLWVNKKY